MRWRFAPRANYSVAIRAKMSRDGFRDRIFNSDGPPLGKNWSLEFTAIVNIPGPYEVLWQVVNTGAEAASHARGLRGGFYPGTVTSGGHTKYETTLYSGMHWVECFIIKNGDCVARSGEFVVNIR